MQSDDELADLVMSHLDEGPTSEEQLARFCRRNARAVYRALRILEGEGRAHVHAYARPRPDRPGIPIWARGGPLNGRTVVSIWRDRPIPVPRS